VTFPMTAPSLQRLLPYLTHLQVLQLLCLSSSVEDLQHVGRAPLRSLSNGILWHLDHLRILELRLAATPETLWMLQRLTPRLQLLRVGHIQLGGGPPQGPYLGGPQGPYLGGPNVIVTSLQPSEPWTFLHQLL